MRVALTTFLVIAMAHTVAAGAPLSRGAASATAAARGDSTGFKSPAKLSDQKRLKASMVELGLPEVPGLKRWEREKAPRVAMVSSMVLPGLGQVYNGRRWKTAVMVSAMTWYGSKAWLEYKKALQADARRQLLPEGSLEWRFEGLLFDFYKESSKDFIWWSGLVWLLGVLDAFIDAHLFDVRSVDPAVIQGKDEKFFGLKVRF